MESETSVVIAASREVEALGRVRGMTSFSLLLSSTPFGLIVKGVSMALVSAYLGQSRSEDGSGNRGPSMSRGREGKRESMACFFSRGGSRRGGKAGLPFSSVFRFFLQRDSTLIRSTAALISRSKAILPEKTIAATSGDLRWDHIEHL
ncbi:hypothetical protein MLD38_034677 [Melastoma candidum]|uniref:Uncharacterized protein n=1 Tax=Melastoma candidum TaxID=119954 RepID=A0ACB9MAP1_9MYRT|nr:hypothetical protein MLD38_034677 [Melastoma candidum]